MINLKELRKNPIAFKEKLKQRGISNGLGDKNNGSSVLEKIVDEVIRLDKQLRKVKTERDALICEKRRLERINFYSERI